jgi:hypothetical protein
MPYESPEHYNHATEQRSQYNNVAKHKPVHDRLADNDTGHDGTIVKLYVDGNHFATVVSPARLDLYEFFGKYNDDGTITIDFAATPAAPGRGIPGDDEHDGA